MMIREHEGIAHWVGNLVSKHADHRRAYVAWYARCQTYLLRLTGTIPHIPLDAPEAPVLTCLQCLALPVVENTAFAVDDLETA